MRANYIKFFVLLALAILSLVACVISMTLGIDYVTIYHGLHPILAGLGCLAAATCCAYCLMGAYDTILEQRDSFQRALDYANKDLPIHIWPDRAP